MLYIKDVTQHLEQVAPLPYQESYDNAGLICGNADWPVKGVLIALDATEPVIDEAIQAGCNLVIAHHPIVFRGLKKLNGSNYVERAVIQAIKHDVAIYASHTNLDNVAGGVNFKIAEKLQLQRVRILAPKKQLLQKLTVFVPVDHTQPVLDALYEAGAGNLGNYSRCSFRVDGTGTFQPNEAANPSVGEKNRPEEVRENRLEVILPAHLSGRVLMAMRAAHPYEEVAYYLTALENAYQDVGSGAIGELVQPVPELEFLSYLKEQMQLPVIRHTALLNKLVRRVAVCGGAGVFLLPEAIRQQADVFITADVKYHEFFDADQRIVLADIGHYESEVHTKELIRTFLSGKFANFALILSQAVTNPIHYT